MPALPTHPDETLTYIFNPTKKDFTCLYDGKPYILSSMKLSSFPKYLADHIAKHLAQELASQDSEKIHFEERFKKHLTVIQVNL